MLFFQPLSYRQSSEGNISNDHPKLDTRRMEPRLSVLGWKSKIIVSDIRRDDHKRSFESRHRNTHSRDFDDTIPVKYKTMFRAAQVPYKYRNIEPDLKDKGLNASLTSLVFVQVKPC